MTPVPEAKLSEEKTKIKAIQNGSLVPVAATPEQVSPALVGPAAPRAGQPEAVLDVDDLKIFDAVDDSELIKGVSFSLPRGKTLGIVGESGSGKTLSVRAVLGIVPKQLNQAGGTVEILGRDSADFTKQDWVDIRGTPSRPCSRTRART